MEDLKCILHQFLLMSKAEKKWVLIFHDPKYPQLETWEKKQITQLYSTGKVR